MRLWLVLVDNRPIGGVVEGGDAKEVAEKFGATIAVERTDQMGQGVADVEMPYYVLDDKDRKVKVSFQEVSLISTADDFRFQLREYNWFTHVRAK